MQIKLYNSLSQKVQPFKPLYGDEVKLYSCGPTVYSYAHIGNMRSFLFADLLQRVLRIVGGYKVQWVMNITNIDDKTIRDSAKGSGAWKPEMGFQTNDPKENLKLFTEFYFEEFIKDIEALGIRSSDLFDMPKATEYIAHMQDLIRRIIDNGYAYVSKGSVYFDVTKWRNSDIYGKLKKIDFENFKPGERVDSDEYEKETAHDFVIWKGRKDGEPFWNFSVYGMPCPGRPGWHIECSAMEYEILGIPFDIHTGGVDLKFPHHEDEIAQSKAGYGVDPNNFWCHNEFLEVEGKKMSKSAGNFFTLRDLINKGIDPLDIRYSMLSTHYGTKFNFTFDGIKAAKKARHRVQDYIYDLHEDVDGDEFIEVNMLREEVFGHLSDDLHTPKALAAVFTFINDNPANELSQISKKALIEFFRDLNNIFSVWTITSRASIVEEIPSEVKELAERRFKAKADQEWALADELRDRIQDLGYIIKDNKYNYELIKI